MVAETADELERLQRKTTLERACGIEVELIGPAALYKLVPACGRVCWGPRFAGRGQNQSAAGDPGDPERSARGGCAHPPADRGLRHHQNGAGFVLTTSSGTLRAGRVVNAAGAWAGRIGAMLVCRHSRFRCAATDGRDRASRTGIASSAGPCRPAPYAEAGGLRRVRNRWRLDCGLDRVHGHPRPLRQSLEGNLWVACRLLPALGRLHVVRSWAAMNIDIDGAPIVGEHPAIPGLFTVVGANGYTLGPLLGQITAQLILRHDPGLDVAAFGIQRFAV